MRFVHTSDWHVGKSFGFADEAAQSLRDERLEAITRIGRLALAQDAPTVLVAGDIYDVPTPVERTLWQPIERMRAFPAVTWHLIPGNHDAHTAHGPWERLRRQKDKLPENMRLHLTPEPAEIAGGAAWLLPAVLTRRHAYGDPTADLDGQATPEGATRIGLAHGSITAFGSDAASTANLIAPDRAERAGLAYLALGDFHGAQSRGDRCWYSGTPETDDFTTGGQGGGEALVVAVDGAGAVPRVEAHRVGKFRWHRMEASLFRLEDIETLEARLRGLSQDDPGSVLVWLKAAGALSLAHMAAFEDRILGGAASALRVLRTDISALLANPTASDLEAIDHAGFVRTAANSLTAMAADPANPQGAIAGSALKLLYVLHMREGRAR